MNDDILCRIYEYLHHLNSKIYLNEINIIQNINKYKKEENHVTIKIEIRCIEILELRHFTGVIEPPVYYFLFKKLLNKHQHTTNY